MSLQTDPEDAFLHNLNQERAAQPVWPYFILAALLLLPLDVAARRVVITQSDLESLRERLAASFGRTPAFAGADPTGRLDRLMDAKDRARMARPPSSDGEAAEPPMQPHTVTQARPRRGAQSVRRADAPKVAPQADRSPQSPPVPGQADGTLASRLLERRRSTRDQDDS